MFRAFMKFLKLLYYETSTRDKILISKCLILMIMWQIKRILIDAWISDRSAVENDNQYLAMKLLVWWLFVNLNLFDWVDWRGLRGIRRIQNTKRNEEKGIYMICLNDYNSRGWLSFSMATQAYQQAIYICLRWTKFKWLKDADTFYNIIKTTSTKK